MSNWDHATDAEYEEGLEAYEPGDPKRPDAYDLAADRADLDRKREKEEGP
jgi:hypothetical protein